MQVKLAFGKTGLILKLPAGPLYSILESRSADPLPDTSAALEEALEHPIGCPALREMARGKRTAAISVCDITRPAPNATTLPPLLRHLHEGGLKAEDIVILIATGLHRPATPEEIKIIVGDEIASRYRVVNHYAKDRTAHRHLGQTPRNTPVYIDERFIAADLHITFGFIEQHLMLGFSGGRKLVAPGLAAQETIKVLHSPRFMREPAAIEGSIADNPLHNELLEIARMARHDFMLDVALTREREIAGVFAGEPVRAHSAGVAFVSQSLLETIPEPVDGVITSAAGYPLDLTFYQTIKGVTAAQHIVKPGGQILVMGECLEGIGAPEFAGKLLHLTSYENYLDQLAGTPEVTVDQWQLEKLALAGLSHRITFYTPGLPTAGRGGLASTIFDTPDAALSDFFSRLPHQARVAIIPDGPYVYARVEAPVTA